jgi:hypothetical protein
MAACDAELKAAGPIPALKRSVAAALAERGAGYRADVRGPLGAAASVAAG